MKKWLILLLVLSAALTGCSSADEENKKTAQPVVEEKVIPVKTEAVGELEFAQAVELSGILAPVGEAFVSAKTSGEVTLINAKMGDSVKANTTLMTLDDTAYKLGKSKAALGIQNADMAYKNAQENLKRSKDLFASGVLSQTELDQVTLQSDLSALGLKSAKLDLESAQMSLDYTTILAPITGVIAEQNGSVGENVAPGQTLFRIVDISSYYVELGASEHVVNKLVKGQLVTCKLPGLDSTVQGLVEQVSPVMSDVSKTYPVKIRIDQGVEGLRVGMSIHTTIALNKPELFVAVRKEAVMVMGEKTMVFVVEDGRAIEREIQIGSSNNTHFQVVSGLTTGEQVVVTGPGLLKSGVKVTVQ